MKILYIEDTNSNIYVIERLARHEGHELLLASNAAQGLELAHQMPDLILMDIGLPDLDGLALTRRIRQFLPDNPIIAVTAHALPEDKANCLLAGCTDYLSKPYKIATLLELLKRYDTCTKS